jgi:hypothetical protein
MCDTAAGLITDRSTAGAGIGSARLSKTRRRMIVVAGYIAIDQALNFP